MIKLINTKGALALATALGFCAHSIVPSNSALVSKPITPVEAQSIKGGIIPIAIVAAAIIADAALISAMIAYHAVLLSIEAQNQNP
ncbi:MAG: hypothetical protein ACI906_001266 [Candidatus Latescibacterota bacterium]|jgi:hypothetical protein